jgi:hypothetical protein
MHRQITGTTEAVKTDLSNPNPEEEEAEVQQQPEQPHSTDQK